MSVIAHPFTDSLFYRRRFVGNFDLEFYFVRIGDCVAADTQKIEL